MLRFIIAEPILGNVTYHKVTVKARNLASLIAPCMPADLGDSMSRKKSTVDLLHKHVLYKHTHNQAPSFWIP